MVVLAPERIGMTVSRSGRSRWSLYRQSAVLFSGGGSLSKIMRKDPRRKMMSSTLALIMPKAPLFSRFPPLCKKVSSPLPRFFFFFWKPRFAFRYAKGGGHFGIRTLLTGNDSID